MSGQQQWGATMAASMSEPSSMYGTPHSSMPPSARTSATEELLAPNRLHAGVVNSISLLDMYDPADMTANRANLRLSNQSLSSASFISSRPISAVSSVSSASAESQNRVVLNYSNSQLAECPADVSHDVYSLNLSFNHIHSISLQFFQPLSKLRVLDLSGNGLRALPRDIGLYFLQLRELRLSKNQIEFLPPSIGAMEDLELLDLGWNMIEMIDPRLFQNMRNLQHLWLQHNRLQTLPPSIGLLSNSLIEILLDGNPFIGPIDEYITPLLLLSEHLPSGYKVNRLTREQLNAKNGQRKSSSVDARASMKNKHWHRARLTLARSRTKSLAMAAPFFHIHHGVSPATSATASPSHTRSSSINDTINEEEPEYINELREDKTAKKGIFHRMRKGSFTGNKPDELYSKSPQLMAQRLSGVNVTGDEPLDNHESDSVAQEAQSKLRRSWRSLRKPISFGSDLNMAAQSPTRSPLGSPYRFEDARQAASSNNFYFPPLPTSVMSSVDETSDTNHTQILRDSGYGVDNTANEETMSNMVFSDEERAALSTTDDGNADFDGLNGFVVSEEVAALAAATKAAFIRRGRNASNGSIRQRASTPALRDAYASGLSGTVSNAGTFARHSSHHRSPSYSRTLTSPRSLMNMSHYPGTATSANASIYDQNSRPSTPLSPAMSIMSIEAGMAQMSLDATNSLSPDEQLQAHAESTMASFEASMTHAYTESAAFEAYSIERRTAMKRLLFYLRDIWDLGVGLQMLKEGDVHVRMLESQPHVPLPEELIGNRPISLDVNGLLRLAERRRRIIDEIISTERTYVQELSCLERFYLRPAFSRNALSPDEIRTIFSNMESLIMFHREHFLPKLEEACEQVAPGNDPPIGQVFMNHSAYIKMYSVYVNNFEDAHTALYKWDANKSHKKWRQIIDEAKTHRSHTQLNIQGYLVMPVQRIPRYRLLLQELYDHTPHSHPDYPCLKAALDEVSKRADEINERKRDYEQCTKVLELQKLIKGSEKIPLLQPHRRFVRDFSLRSARESRLQASKRIRFSQAPAVTIRHKRIDKEYRFFVFGDILLQCKVHGHLNKETELVRCIRLGGRRDQIELLEEENEVRIVDEDAIIYVTGSHNELVELMNAIATR